MLLAARENPAMYYDNEPLGPWDSVGDAMASDRQPGYFVSDGNVMPQGQPQGQWLPTGDEVIPAGYCQSCGCAATCCQCRPRCRPCDSYVFGEFLYLHPVDADMVHAQQQNGIGGAGTVPFGQIGAVDPSYDPGARIGFGCAIDNCSRIVGSYTWFEGDSVNIVDPPTITGGGGAVGSFVHHPNASITASVGPVRGEYELGFQLADFAFQRVLWCGRSSRVNGSMGAIYGNLKQDFGQSGVFAGGSAGTIDTTTDIEFDGAGLKFGLDGNWAIGQSCWSFYGKGSVAALTGQFRSHYTMLNSTTDVLLADAVWRDDRVVTLVDYEVGLAWTSCRGRWRASTGYLFSHWNNAVTTADFIDAVQADNYVDVGDTISFNGFTGRVECRF
jgi:hypothetical protein